MKNCIRYLVGLSLFVSSASYSNEAIQQQAQCYANLLGIKKPKVVITNNLPATREGLHRAHYSTTDNTFMFGEIYLAPDASFDTLAHEMRHEWQHVKNQNRSNAFQQTFYRYENLPSEIDANQWAARNWQKCPLKRKLGAVCDKFHKVGKNDTWWSLHIKYRKPKSWLNARANTILPLNQKICIRSLGGG